MTDRPRWALSMMDYQDSGAYVGVEVEDSQLIELDLDEIHNFWHNLLDQMLDQMAGLQPSGEKDVCYVCGEFRELRKNGTTAHLCTRMLEDGTGKVCQKCGCYTDAPGHILTKCAGVISG